jgi:hypothetical protein
LKLRKPALAAAGLALASVSCDFPTTVYGRLVLKPGENGDVRLARVELLDTTGWGGAPVLAVEPDTGGQFNRCSFLFPVVEPGPYYLLAWQDVNGDGELSNGDLAGVYADSLRPGIPGRPVIVYDGWTVDAGYIELAGYTELRITASGLRVQGDSLVEFAYSFTNDVTLTSLDVAFPGADPVPDPTAPGKKGADSLYYSSHLKISQGSSAPAGLYTLTFRGLLDTVRFSNRAVVRVD